MKTSFFLLLDSLPFRLSPPSRSRAPVISLSLSLPRSRLPLLPPWPSFRVPAHAGPCKWPCIFDGTFLGILSTGKFPGISIVNMDLRYARLSRRYITVYDGREPPRLLQAGMIKLGASLDVYSLNALKGAERRSPSIHVSTWAEDFRWGGGGG